MAVCVCRKYNQSLKKDIVITHITESQAKKPKWCNTNNHKFTEFDSLIQKLEKCQISKADYFNAMEHTQYSKFVKYVTIKDPINNPMLKMHLKATECEELFEIAKIANISGQIPLSRKDDFYYVLYNFICREVPCNLFVIQPSDSSKYSHAIKEYMGTNPNCEYTDIPQKYYELNKRYFIRLNECSPKDSDLGMGPHSNVKDMLQSLVCSCRTRKSLQKAAFENDDELFENWGNGTFLFCVPWRDDILSKNEFRCFVKNKSLKAVPQYVWYSDFGWIQKQNILFSMCEKIQKWADLITEHIEFDEYVLDIHVLFGGDDDYKIEMIECNSFGAQMASGSGCFHWIRHYNQLYGIEKRKNQIEVRIVANELPSKSNTATLDAVQNLLDIFDK